MTATRKTTTAFATVVALLVVAVAYLVARQPVQANHTPADKVSGGASDVQNVQPATVTPGPGTIANNIIDPVTVRSSKPSDMILSVSLECSILTQVTSSGATPSSTAEGLIRVWVVIDGKIVPVTSSSSPPQNPPADGADSDKVTFCNRMHRLAQTDTENPADGLDTTESFIRTKEANAFNWLRFNMGSGIHTIEVRADLFTNELGTATAEGFVGNRTLVGQPVKMANDASF